MAGFDSKVVGLLHFDDDVSGFDEVSGNQWTGAGGVTVDSTNHRFGTGCAGFAGTSYLRCTSALFNFGVGDFTVEGWVFLRDDTAQYPSLFTGSNTGDAFALRYSFTGPGYLRFNSSQYVLTSKTIPTATWTHVAVARHNGVFYVFYDGVNVLTDATHTDVSYNLGNLTIGYGVLFGSISGLNGYVDELRVSRVARYVADFTPATAPFTVDADTLVLLHVEPIVNTDEAGRHWTSVNMAEPSQTQAKFGHSSLYLNGANYLSTVNDDQLRFGSGDFTIDWWECRADAAYQAWLIGPNANYTNIVIGQSDGVNSTVHISAGATWDIVSFNLGSIDANQWTHFALVRCGDTFYGFKNGTLTSTTTKSLSICQSSPVLYVGFNPINNKYFNGYVDELRISKGVARWTSNFTPPTTAYSKIHYLARTADDHYHAYLNSVWVDLGQAVDQAARRQLFLNNEVVDPFGVAELQALTTTGLVTHCAYQASSSEATPTESIHAAPVKAQLVNEVVDVSLKNASYVDWFKVSASIGGHGQLKLLASRDSGVTWWAFSQSTSTWSKILDSTVSSDGAYVGSRFTPTDAGLARALTDGMTPEVFNTVDWNAWTLGDGFKQIRFACVLNVETTADQALMDSIQYQYDGTGKWEVGTAKIDYRVLTDNTSHTFTWLSPAGGKRVKINY